MKNILYIIIISIILYILFNLIYIKYNNIYNKNNNIDTVEIVKVDSFIKKDTVTKWYPKPVEIKVRDTIYLSTDSVKTEGDSILLPREEKTYTDDSTYNLKISGFKPSLDEITVYPRTTYIVTEKVREIEKKDRFSWGLQLGVGYGLVHRKPDIYVGIGGQINF